MKLFYLFIKINPWRMRGLSGDSTHMMRGEVGAPQFRGCLPLLYKEGWELPLPKHLLSSLSPPAAPPLGHPLGEAMAV